MEGYWEACSGSPVLLGWTFKPPFGIKISLALLVRNEKSNKHVVISMMS